MIRGFLSAVVQHFKADGKAVMGERPEDVVLWAQRSLASDFPNPHREDCPNPASLRNLITSGQFPDADLKAHLLSCSDCFGEYKTMLAAQRQQGQVTSFVNGGTRRVVPRLDTDRKSTRLNSSH